MMGELFEEKGEEKKEKRKRGSWTFLYSTAATIEILSRLEVGCARFEKDS